MNICIQFNGDPLNSDMDAAWEPGRPRDPFPKKLLAEAQKSLQKPIFLCKKNLKK